jgi:hypothetical protein
MPGGRDLLRRVGSAPNVEQLLDYLAEVRYALVFAGLAFEVEVEPQGKAGPDLAVARNGHFALVEVRRFRKVYPGPPMLDPTKAPGVFPVYGKPERDIQKAFDKILDKFRQVPEGDSIIAIWNDDEDMEEVEVAAATCNIRTDAALGRLNVPAGLLFVVYGSKWISSAPDGRQLYCYDVRRPATGHQQVWQQELDSSTVHEHVQRSLSQLNGSGRHP